MASFTNLPVELQTRILRFTPLTSQLVARKVCKLWSQIVSTRGVQKSRYVPTFTTEGLPNLHRLLAFDGCLRFTIQNNKIIALKFWRFQGDKKGCEAGAWKNFNTEWLNITNHPFLDEPAFSPFIRYNSRQISDELSKGPRHLMILDNVYQEIDILESPFRSLSYDYREFRRRWASEGLTVRDIIEESAERIFSIMRGSSVQPHEDRVYDVVLTHGWRSWENRWVGVMKCSLVAPMDRCKQGIDEEKKGRKKKS